MFEITQGMVGQKYVQSYTEDPVVNDRWFTLVDVDAGTDSIVYSNPITITQDMVGKWLGIHFKFTTVGTFTFSNIQVEQGSSHTSFAPYENLCPISGWDKVELNHAGKNLFDSTGLSMISCYGINGDAMIRRGKRLDLPPGDYVFSSTNLNGLSAYIYTNICNADGSFYRFDYAIGGQTATVPRPYTLTEGQYFLVYDAQAKLESDVNKFEYYSIQIEKGSTASLYEPYTADPIINITFPDELGTVYGAQLDVLNGLLRVTQIQLIPAKADFRKNSDWQFYFLPNSQIGVGKDLPCMCNRLRAWDGVESLYKHNYYCFQNSGGAIRVNAADSFSTADDAYDAIGEMEFVCTLATPIEIQLTPEQVNSFLGFNNIWADTGDTHAIYRADIGLYIQKLTGSTEEDMTANVNIDSGKYFLVGNTLYLSTSAIAAGEQIIPGTNCTLTNLAAALNALNS